LIYAIGITFIVAVTHSCLAFVQTSQWIAVCGGKPQRRSESEKHESS
jgi:hypothetical protein